MKRIILVFTCFYLFSFSFLPANSAGDEAFLGSGSFIIRTNSDYRYLTIKEPSPVAGSIVFMWRFTENDGQQRWRFIPQGGDFYKIKSESGLFLTQKRVLLPTMDPEANEDAQLWKITRLPDGFYTIMSKLNKFVVVSDPRRRNGGLVGFANSISNTDPQKWHFIKWTDDGRRMTRFTPAEHGFKFANSFAGVDASYRYGGLCGGMVYGSMDYFRNARPIPTQTYKPANRTPLQSFIYGRQNDAAMVNQLDKWTELRVNPFGWRDSEFYEWGLQGTGGGRWEELQQVINGGNPAPLGLYEGGTANFEGEKAGDHQVLAIGFAAGRYRGDKGDFKQDMKIFIYDPNFPGLVMTMVPDISRKCFFYIEEPLTRRTYFVDKKYSPKRPPDIASLAANEPDGSIRNIYVTFLTGGDDLRGGNDNVNLVVNYRDGSSQTFMNVNGGARWVDNYEETVPFVLNRAVSRNDIISFRITTSFSGGLGGDNWNLDKFYVTNGGDFCLACRSCRSNSPKPLFRFTGEQKMFTVMVPSECW